MTVQEAIAAAEAVLPGIEAPGGELDPRWQANHFETIFPRAAALSRKSALFADSVSRCWKYGKTEEPANAALLDELRREIGTRKKRRR